MKMTENEAGFERLAVDRNNSKINLRTQNFK